MKLYQYQYITEMACDMCGEASERGVNISSGAEYIIEMCIPCLFNLGLIAEAAVNMPKPWAHSRDPEPTMITHIVYKFCLALCENKRYIMAIKELRAMTGMGLRECKHQVEHWRDGHSGWDQQIRQAILKNAPQIRRYIHNWRKKHGPESDYKR